MERRDRTPNSESRKAPDGPDRPGPRERKKPRKISPKYLENSALHYLKRYSTTVKNLRRVMTRKINRSIKFHQGDLPQALGWLEELLAKLQRGGLVNDESYAETRVHSLRAGGRSARVIEQKLRLKGVPEKLAKAKVAEAVADVPEEVAAQTWARRKKLGPYRRDLTTRKENRQRDLASLARAGFSFGIAKSVIDG